MHSFARLGIVLALVAGLPPLAAAEPQSIRIGYAVSKTGAYAPGTNTTILPNYRLWVSDVNAQGGILLSSIGRRVPLEVIEYDDQSNPTEALKAVERLATVDKVDFVLPPWGTHLNVTVAPLFNRYRYPHLPGAVQVEDPVEFARSYPYTFLNLGVATGGAEELVKILAELRREGRLGEQVAIMRVADSFGTINATAAQAALKREKFKIVYERTYPVGTPDMRPMLRKVMERNPDIFLAYSYPPDTMAITAQAIELNFSPKIFYTSVGTAYPVFRDRFGSNAEGVMGAGGWNASAPALQDYFRRHVAVIGREPDRWASPVTYATLQILQQAIERVGSLDRAAIREVIAKESFSTIMGPVHYVGNLLTPVWYAGQWQGGEFYGVAPTELPGARALMFPKPAWRSAD